MNNIKKLVLSTVAASLIVGCGGGGGSSSTEATTTSVLVEDGIIIGAKVIDDNNNTATHEGNGVYTFDVDVKLPIKITSENNTTDSTIAGGHITFQDLDNNGEWSTGDIAYNASMKIKYTANLKSIKANPVAALIPANWNGESNVSGLTKAEIDDAVGLGVKASSDANKKKIQEISAKLTAVQESAKKMGLDNDQVSDILSNITTDISSGFETAIKNSISKLTISEDQNTSLQKIAKAVDDTNLSAVENAESIVSVIVENTDENASVTAEANLSNLADLVTTADNSIKSAQEIAVSGLKVLVESLKIVPVYQDEATILDDSFTNGLTSFKLTYDDSSENITLTYSNGNDMFFKDQNFTLDATSSYYSYTTGTKEAKINLNIDGMRAFTYTDDNTNDNGWHIYPLATQSEISDANLSDAQNATISGLNAL